ncbi:MAG: Lipid-A-disaccharide synthase [Chroococcopsis gigantea SAG 12.99]|jgi:hypothetical protein|nr:lipid-A-disaccharide synthase [Chlorogloea purpurea SAG 13.99]MDV3001641.1 Lipid-A-disaccharide synthase [Chroococcopsis gigantea SAG 12.99]
MFDVLILSNGPGEVSTWVRPVVKALRQSLRSERLRISVILSPCTHAMGTETEVVKNYPEVNRVQSPEHFFNFLFSGKTADNWDWYPQGLVVFLGGDQFFTLVIAKRLGYQSLIYGEWEARWYRWLDRFAVTSPAVRSKIPIAYRHKVEVVGDLMLDVERCDQITRDDNTPVIAFLPGSKPWKLSQGLPLSLATAEVIARSYPRTRFIIPVAPTLDLSALAGFADPRINPIIDRTGWRGGVLVGQETDAPYLETPSGIKIELIKEFPAHRWLANCDLALTTVGANTAELGGLGVPMIVLLPTQQLDAMRTWDGIPGLLANLPGIGSTMAKIINRTMLKQKRLYAWPNIWAGQEIVPELLGELEPEEVGRLVISFLDDRHKLSQIRESLRKVRGESGAAAKIATIVRDMMPVRGNL